MGVVYAAMEESLNRRVALKVISPQFASDDEFRTRFTREAHALGALDSPHVVQVYGHGEEDGRLYIATQLIPDGDLGELVQTYGTPPHKVALELIAQVATGLADAHEAGLIHRDIKPGNVLLRRRAGGKLTAYLGDFGIARHVDSEYTQVGSGAIGTPAYMAPELHTGTVAGVRSDIYSMGCLLWTVLSGRTPYQGSSEFELVSAHYHQPIPQLTGEGPVVAEINAILRTSMAKDPGQRYPSAAAFRDHVERASRLAEQAAEQSTSVAAHPGPGGQPQAWAGGSVAPPPERPEPPRAGPFPSGPGYSGPSTPPAPASPPPSPQRPASPHPPMPPQRAAAPANRRKGLIIGGAAAAAAVLVIGGIAAASLLGGDGKNGDPGNDGGKNVFEPSGRGQLRGRVRLRRRAGLRGQGDDQRRRLGPGQAPGAVVHHRSREFCLGSRGVRRHR